MRKGEVAAGRPDGCEWDIEERHDEVCNRWAECLKVGDVQSTYPNNLVGVYSAAGTPRVRANTNDSRRVVVLQRQQANNAHSPITYHGNDKCGHPRKRAP